MRRAALATGLALAALAAPAARADLPPLVTGVTDNDTAERSPEGRPLAYERIRAARASVIRVFREWSAIERVKPPDLATARNPDWSGYDWGETDAILRDAAAARLRPLLSFLSAPAWAEGPGRPPVSDDAPAGTWRPSPAAYAAFAEAAARRYSGRHPDPLRPGATLPRVRDWQAWNEPNLTDYLTPQWRAVGDRRFEPRSPGVYKALLNAFYDAVKAVDPSNLVVSAGTAPYGEPVRGERRMGPALFTRTLLCVAGRKRLRAYRCPDGRARFDALAHHPYPIGPPGRHAINPDDVVVPDFAKLTRPLAVAVRAGTVYPRAPKQVWATEIAWDSSPPDPNGIELNLHARYVEGSLYVLWRQGVDVVTWFNLRDEAERRGFQFGQQSGLYFRGETVAQDTPKPALTAYRFPFTAYRGGIRSRLWGIAPAPGAVRVDRLGDDGVWRAVARLRAGPSRVFLGTLPTTKGVRLRAVAAGETSLSWRVD